MNQERNEWSSVAMFRMVGYGLLLFFLADLISLLSQVQIFQVLSVYQTLGGVVERVPLPLLGLMLVLSGETTSRQRWERRVLRAISWGTLAAGILFLLLIPTILAVSIQLSLQAEAGLNAQTEQQLSKLQQTENQVNRATTQDLNYFLERLRQQNQATPNIKDSKVLREQLLADMKQVKQTVKSQAETARSGQRIAVLRDSTKWCFGSLVAGLLLIYLWRFSSWARRKGRIKLRTTEAT